MQELLIRDGLGVIVQEVQLGIRVNIKIINLRVRPSVLSSTLSQMWDLWWKGYKEHLKAPSAIHHHSNQTGHTTNQNNFQNNREGGAQFS